MTTPSTPPALPDLISGLGIALWYSLPDYTDSRATRTIVKTGIVVSSAAYGYGVLKGDGTREGNRAATADGAETDDAAADGAGAAGATPSTAGPRVAGVRKAAVLGLAAVVVGASAATTVAMERAVYRYGERLSGRGVRLAHTRIGIVLAASTTIATVALEAARGRRPGGGPEVGSRTDSPSS